MDDEEILGLSRGIRGSQGLTSSSDVDTTTVNPLNKSTLDFALKRSRTFGASLSGLNGSTGSSPSLEALMIGDFSSFPIRLGLAFDGRWRRTAECGYDSTEYPLHIRPLSQGIVHVSTEPSPASATQHLAAYPDAFESVARSDFFISVNDPSLLLRTPLPFDGSSLPVNALALTGNFSDPFLLGKDSQTEAKAKYDLELRILMKDETSAKMYRPVVRFIWAALAGRLFGQGNPASTLVPEQEGSIYIVRGIALGTQGLKDLLVAVSQGL